MALTIHRNLTGIGKYTGEMVAWMAQEGHEVRVITAPPPYYHSGRSVSAIPLWRYRREGGGATVWRFTAVMPKHYLTLKRLLHLGALH